MTGRNNINSVTIFIFIVIIGFSPCIASEHMLLADFGVSKNVSDSEHWNFGASAAISYFNPLTSYFLVGGHIGLHWWTPEGNPNGKVGASWDAEGMTWLFDFYPSIRITTPIHKRKRNALFIQIGAGLTYIYDNSTLTITPVILDAVGWDVDLVESQLRPGFSIGVGLMTINEGEVRFEFYPKYHVVFTSDEYTHYVSINIGGSIKF